MQSSPGLRLLTSNRRVHFGWNKAAAITACIFLFLIATRQNNITEDEKEWRLAPELGPLLRDLSAFLSTKSAVSKFTECTADALQLEGSHGPILAALLKEQLGAVETENGTAPADLDGDPHNQKFTQATILSAPCGANKIGACCEHTVFFRPKTTDFGVYEQIFIEKQLQYLYSIFEHQHPKYILDAGANAGFSTVLFKLLWPDAVIVSVEPNKMNFEALKMNTAALKDVHPINAGLWGRNAMIGTVGNHGEWGLVFQEIEEIEKEAGKKSGEGGGMQAYSVADLARKFDVPAFDFVKIDIEGAEGQVFAPGIDVSWVDNAMAVSLEIHDFFHGYFGLGDHEISQRVSTTFRKRPFGVAAANEHTIYIRYKTLYTMLTSEIL